MRVENEALLDKFRGPGKCDWCRTRCKRREPHHIFAKGMGGGRRLDVAINLIALGSAFDCACHRQLHDGHITRADVLAVVANREKTRQDWIEDVLYLLIRLPKDPKEWQLKDELEMLGSALPLAILTLTKIGLGCQLPKQA